MKKEDIKKHPSGFVMIKRNHQLLYLLRKRPSAINLAFLIAFRAKRTRNMDDPDLKVGEAKIGDYREYRSTEQRYRTDKKYLEKYNIATFKSTSEGTVARFINTDFFDINEEKVTNELVNHQRTDNGQQTSNNNDNKEKNDKNIHTSPEVESVENKISNKRKCPNNLDGHKGCIQYITSFGENRGVKFPNFGKQINALHKLLAAGYSFEEIDKEIEVLEKDKFWGERGFDLMNVANEIGKGGRYAKTT